MDPPIAIQIIKNLEQLSHEVGLGDPNITLAWISMVQTIKNVVQLAHELRLGNQKCHSSRWNLMIFRSRNV